MTPSFRALLASLALFPTAGLSAQTVFLSEDFSAGVVPPAGWVEQNNGVSLGWELDGARNMPAGHAFHDDYYGLNDNTLMSPQMNLSGATGAYVHAWQGVYYASWRDHHYVEVSLDNGSSFVVILDDLAPDGYQPLEADASAYAGINGVNVAFHYTGDFASEWGIDDIVVDDVAPPPPPPAWPNLPASFQVANGYQDGFEVYGGVAPPFMALNALDANSGFPDPEAWCNIGQLAPPLSTAAGLYCLEMGLMPGSTNYHDVRNGLAIGLDGMGAATVMLDFSFIDHGEEGTTWDGVWVSDDGLTWSRARGNWGGTASWTPVTGVDLSATGANTAGQFFLLFAQHDNFPYGYLDGIGIDEISVTTSGSVGPVLSVTNLVAGQVATISVANATPGSFVRHGFSLTGGGPIGTPFGNILLSQPVRELPFMPVGVGGTASMNIAVPPGLTGTPVWFHAMDLLPRTFTNGVAKVIG